MLFLLTPRNQNDAIWSWGCAYGFVVRAADQAHAREFVASRTDDESRPGDEGAGAWLDPEKTNCTPIEPNGPPAVVLRNFCDG